MAPTKATAEAESILDESVYVPSAEVQVEPQGGDSTLVQNTDSLIMLRKLRANDYWKQQLMKGKLDLNDESIRYPSFLQMCVNLYRWGDRTFNSYDP